MNVHTFRLAEEMGRPTMYHTEEGDEARRIFNKFTDATIPGDTIVIDCEGVEIFDASFAGAFFAQIIVGLPVSHPERMLIVRGLNKSTQLNLDLVLEKLGVMLAEVEEGKMSLLGKKAAVDVETLEFMLSQKEPLSVRDFAERLQIKATAANERLSKLAKMAILHRFATSGGRTQQLYAAPSV